MSFRLPEASTSSSSPPPWGLEPSSPPSSPTPTTSFHSLDPFSGSAKSLSISQPRQRRWARSATTPAAPRTAHSLDVPNVDHHDREALLEQFFDEASEDEDASMVEMGSSYDAPSTFARPFVRTDSANTDPLSAAGRVDSMQRAPQRTRLTGTSPKKLTRHGSHLAPWEQADDPPPSRPGDVPWDAVVTRVFDEGREHPTLLFGGHGLTHISNVIGDLRHYVTIEHTRSRLELYLWDNLLTKLPSALFQLTNLGVLSLRKNQLTRLPAAIGELRHLRELNIGGNALTYLPAEIQQLQLDTFTYVPNPFVCVPPGSLLDTRHVHGDRPAPPPPGPRWTRAHTLATVVPEAPTTRVIARVLGPCERRRKPSLANLCMQRLLSDDPLVIEQYETGCLRALEHTVDARFVARIEAARRSATASWGTRVDARDPQVAWYAGADNVDAMLEADDACHNVWFNRCPAHGLESRTDWPSRSGPLFVDAAEERIEWVSHVAGVRVAKQGIEMAGASVRGMPAEHAGCLPILWRGCSVGCLAFLDDSL